MKELLKKIPGARKLSHWGRSFLRSFRDNPDMMGKIERALFEYRQKSFSLMPPTPREGGLIRDLRESIRKLPVEMPDSSTSGAKKLWMNYKNELRTKILTEDPREFLRWNVVGHTMGATLDRLNFNELAAFPFWKEWSRAIASLSPANQMPHFKFPKTDGTTLVHVYHLAQLKTHANIDVSDTDLIIDFGGGYGAMCAAAHALGFKGQYVMFDLPEFLLLQQFYLKLRNISVKNIKLISDLTELKKEIRGRRGLLIATWSISEVPEEFREKFFDAVNPEKYLIGYQSSVGEVDNNVYFRKFAEAREDIMWKDFPALNFSRAGNRYLMGGPKR